MVEREGIAEFQCRESFLGMILATKMVNFYVKWFHMMRGAKN
jgi:hypothetical protein